MYLSRGFTLGYVRAVVDIVITAKARAAVAENLCVAVSEEVRVLNGCHSTIRLIADTVDIPRLGARALLGIV